MLELFQEQVDQYLAELNSSLEKGDATTVRRILHTLKSTLANYGGRRLRATAQRLENDAANGNLESVCHHTKDFATGVRKFRDVLMATATEFSSPPAGR
jgi:HPt (histidine-containing phosphotransfer) domain-containing protein